MLTGVKGELSWQNLAQIFSSMKTIQGIVATLEHSLVAQTPSQQQSVRHSALGHVV